MTDNNDINKAVGAKITLRKDQSLRMGYFQKLKGVGEYPETFMAPPAHWLDPNLFTLTPNLEGDHAPRKVGSFITILSVWNTMIGSSIVAIPYCTYQAGIIPTIVINFINGLICFYTCQVVVKTGGRDSDYSDTVHRYFGTRFGYAGRVLQILFNLSINLGAVFIYFLIINQNLYPCLAFLLKSLGMDIDASDLSPSFSRFSIIYCGILISIAIFPLLILKQMNFLIKINSFGIYFVSILLLYIFYTGIFSLTNTNYVFDYKKNNDTPPDNNPRYLYLFGENPSLLAGTLSMGYFSHSFVLPMMKNSIEPKNNRRNLFIGYLLVFFTYVGVSIFGYIGFSGKNFSAKFHDNWFRFFPSDNIIILILRLLNVFQLLTIFPILVFVVRIQFFGTFFESSYPSRQHILVFSSSLVVVSLIILYLCWDILGELISVIGAATGLFLIYLIPLIVNMVYYKRKHPESLIQRDLERMRRSEDNLLVEEIFEKKLNENGNDNESKPTESVEDDRKESQQIVDIDDFGVSEKPYSKIKNTLFYISQYGLMIYGLFILVIQFLEVNFFAVHIK